MFKVGDRVRHKEHGTVGTIVDENGMLWVKYDDFPPGCTRVRYSLDAEQITGGIELLQHTYKPGDKIVATCEHGPALGLERAIALTGDVGEYLKVTSGINHRVKFNGEEYWCFSEHIAPYTATPVQRPTLSCARCGEPNQYAEVNLPSGGYACYSCRKYHAYAIGGG